MYNFDPYNVLLSIATNIPVLLMTAFVLQGHISDNSGCWESDVRIQTQTHHQSWQKQQKRSQMMQLYDLLQYCIIEPIYFDSMHHIGDETVIN